jgi:hypothetical protein
MKHCHRLDLLIWLALLIVARSCLSRRHKTHPHAARRGHGMKI